METFNYCDLHFHTYYSPDAFNDPEKVVEVMKQSGCGGFVVADHNTLDAIPVFQKLAPIYGLEFIPGVEINANHTKYGGVHILGYGFDPNHKELQAMINRKRAGGDKSFSLVFDEYHRLALIPDQEDFMRWALSLHPKRRVGHKHLSLWLVQIGKVNTINEGKKYYQKTLDELRGERHTVASSTSTTDVVQLISAAGGVTVLAHPAKIRGPLEEIIPEFAKLGVSGVEAYTPKNGDLENQEYIATLARNNKMVVTGGSDYHGITGRTWPSLAPFKCFLNLKNLLER